MKAGDSIVLLKTSMYIAESEGVGVIISAHVSGNGGEKWHHVRWPSGKEYGYREKVDIVLSKEYNIVKLLTKIDSNDPTRS